MNRDPLTDRLTPEARIAWETMLKLAQEKLGSHAPDARPLPTMEKVRSDLKTVRKYLPHSTEDEAASYELADRVLVFVEEFMRNFDAQANPSLMEVQGRVACRLRDALSKLVTP